MGKYRKYIEFGALVLLAAALIWWFGRRLDWAVVSASVRSSDWRLILLACVIVLVAYLWRALRWGAFLAPLCTASRKELWKATTIGFAAVLLVGRAGEVVRPVVLPMRDRRVRPAASFVTIMIERVYDTMMVVFAFAVSVALLPPPPGSSSDFASVRKWGWLLLLLGIFTVTCLVIFRLQSPRIIGRVERILNKFHGVPIRVRRAVLSLLDQLARALGILANARELAVTILWTALLWGSVILANLLVFRAFDLRVGGKPLGFSQTLFVLGCSMMGSVVPTPGVAAGAFHAATGAGLVILGVDKDQAAAASIILHLVDFGPAAAFGLFYFLSGDVSLARLRELTKPEAVEHAVEDEQITPEEVLNQKRLRCAPEAGSSSPHQVDSRPLRPPVTAHPRETLRP